MAKYIFPLFILVVASSCSNFLTKEPQGPAYDANYFNTNPSHPQLAVNAIYDAISWDNGGRAESYQAYELFFGDICSDDANIGSKPGDGLISTLQQLKEWRATPSHVSTRAVWNNMYAAIARANYVLTYIDKATSIDQATKNQLKGEALFLRGYAYFYLVRLFGGVPIINKILATTDYGKIPRSTIPQTYSFIEEDWKNAIELLPIAYATKDLGRATKGAAQSYLARAILYQLGTDNGNKHTWQEVYDYSGQVINSGKYALAPNYATLFEDEMENGQESIFEIQYQDNGSGNGDGPASTGSYADQLQNPRTNWGWGYNSPSDSLIAAFEPGDPRLACTVLKDGDILYGVKFKVNASEDPLGKLNRKAALPKQASYFYNGPRNHRKMRFADVILMHAEAAYHLGYESEAISDVNKIRARAKASTLPKGSALGDATSYLAATVPGTTLKPLENTLTGQALLDAIWKERRVELGMESLRYWDLVRTNRYFSILSTSAEANCRSHSVPGSVNQIPLFPITNEDVSFNVSQNPGY